MRAQVADAAAVLDAAGFSAADRDRALGGQIVTLEFEEPAKGQISAAVGAVLKAPVSKVYAAALGGKLFALDPAITGHGQIALPATAASFAGMSLPPAEVDRLAKATPGSDSNLSTSEIQALQAAAPNGAAAVQAAFHGALAARVEAYRRGGIAAIAPYDRGQGSSTSPGDALRTATDSDDVTKRFAPTFHAALAQYPKATPAGADERFYWALVDVQGRPTVVLVQRLLGQLGAEAVLSERQFYASQGFNALQVSVLAVPVAQGTALVYLNRTSSDQAARYGRMAQSIGGRMIVSEVQKHFDAVRRELGG